MARVGVIGGGCGLQLAWWRARGWGPLLPVGRGLEDGIGLIGQEGARLSEW